MKEIEWEQYKLFVLTQSSGAKIITEFVQDHTTTTRIII